MRPLTDGERNAFRKLPNTARLTLLADAYELTTRTAMSGPPANES